MKIPGSDFFKNNGALADKVMVEPVPINGSGRHRRVVRLEDFTDDEISAIVGPDVPAGFEYLDEELKRWKP